jgi:hypothetical protein
MRWIDNILGAIAAIGGLDASTVVAAAKSSDNAARGFAV